MTNPTLTDCTPTTGAWVVVFLALVLAVILGAVFALRETAATPRARQAYSLVVRILAFAAAGLALIAVAVLAGVS